MKIVTEELVEQVKALRKSGKTDTQIQRELQISSSAFARAVIGKINELANCRYCGKEFRKMRPKQAYCCQECNKKDNKKSIETVRYCKICRKVLTGCQRKYCAVCVRKVKSTNPTYKTNELIGEVRPELPSNRPNIIQLNTEARKRGLTYGEYMASLGK